MTFFKTQQIARDNKAIYEMAIVAQNVQSGVTKSCFIDGGFLFLAQLLALFTLVSL